MEAATEDFTRSDLDPEMTVLTPDDITGQNLEGGDEVENLRNSLREAVHDDSVRPKMQCLMMDSSFSMVTMQGEDSGIAWETTPSRSATPWMSEAGNSSVDLGSAAAARPATPGSHPAGKIIFVMDEDVISRRKKPKEKVSVQRRVLVESSENVSGRPELVEVSQPNLKTEDGGAEEEPADPLEHKEKQLFRLVSEGSEILNIVVPPKLATVDEEESREMEDNLSYLEESPVPKASEESHDSELLESTASSAAAGILVRPSLPAGPDAMDPPGAPVARPPGRAAPGNVDYFEAFALIDAQAPGSPAVVSQGQEEPEAAAEIQDTKKPMQAKQMIVTTSLEEDKSDTISLEEMTSELLDEVFYGGTDDSLMKSLDSAGGGVSERPPSRLPSKPSGSTLFGSQEEILTPIFLPEGPPKIIDPILLEEPKAMAFLYTDLYEEAMGTRKKDEDTESLTSEKSFHSRHSDREARGYLEKYVLIDETPAVELGPTEADKGPKEGPRVLTQDLYEFGDLLTKSEKNDMPNSEEEITDFFRSSANSSPCDIIEPFARSLEEDDAIATKTKPKTEKSVSIKAAETPLRSVPSFEFSSEVLDWGGTDDHPAVDDKDVSSPAHQEMWKQDSDTNKPVAPPRRKVASSPKACLDLTPLTPVDGVAPESEEAGGKEQREEEKETASPAETADEGDGDGEEAVLVASDIIDSDFACSATEGSEHVADNDEATQTVEEEKERSEAAAEQTELGDINVQTSESDTTEKQDESSAEPAKSSGRCVIL